MKISRILFFLLLFGLCGYFREFLFVHINRIMFGKYYDQTVYDHESIPAIMRPFVAFSYEDLYYLKYFLTLGWVLIFLALNYLAIKKLSGESFLLKVLLYTYGVLFIMAVFAMAYGYLVLGRLQDDEYTLSRWLMGIAQSPLICLILLASEKLYKKSIQSQ